MGKAFINDTTITNIANAIRSKFGLTGTLKLSDMLTALQGVKKPGSYVWGKFDFIHFEKGALLGYIVGDNESDYPDKADQDGYYYEKVFPALITFTINGTFYQAKEGMNWAEWVNSEYNTKGFSIGSGLVLYNNNYVRYQSTGVPVGDSELILKNEYYSVMSGGGGGGAPH